MSIEHDKLDQVFAVVTLTRDDMAQLFMSHRGMAEKDAYTNAILIDDITMNRLADLMGDCYYASDFYETLNDRWEKYLESQSDTCGICHKPEDADGRCGCTNKDAN